MQRTKRISQASIYIAGIVAAMLITLFGLAANAGAITNYVALGDSFASGLGADTNQYQGEKFWEYDPATVIEGQNQCYRATNNAYAPRLAASQEYALTFAACQGATTAEILTTSQFPQQPRQIDFVTSDTNLITLQIGGNDAQYKDIVTCVLTTECTINSVEYQESLAILQNELPSRLDAVYAAIAQRAPEATVLAVDYAPILPKTYQQATLCFPYMSQAELQLGRDFLTMLNQTVKSAAERNGATYVLSDYVGSPFNGRDWIGLTKNACSPSAGSTAWSLRFLTNGGNVSFHPTAYGQQFYAQIIASHL